MGQSERLRRRVKRLDAHAEVFRVGDGWSAIVYSPMRAAYTAIGFPGWGARAVAEHAVALRSEVAVRDWLDDQLLTASQITRAEDLDR